MFIQIDSPSVALFGSELWEERGIKRVVKSTGTNTPRQTSCHMLLYFQVYNVQKQKLPLQNVNKNK